MAVQEMSHTSLGVRALRKRESLWTDVLRQLARNRQVIAGVLIVAACVGVAVLADFIAVKPYGEQALADSYAVPGWLVSIFPQTGAFAKVNDAYPLGTDKVGRDMFSRIVYGARISLSVALVAPLVSLLVGLAYGSLAGYFGGWLDDVMMRVVDLLYGFPTLLLMILLMVAFRSAFAQADIEPGSWRYVVNRLDALLGNLLFVFVGISLTAWVGLARLARGQVLSIREREYIQAARALGGRHTHILLRHILPNIIGPLIVIEALAVPGYIMWEASLSFIGLGVSPPTPSWGLMIAEGASGIRTYPHLVLAPSLALAIVMVGFSLLGDGLRDVLDPRLRDKA